jgi:hypothetical protein
MQDTNRGSLLWHVVLGMVFFTLQDEPMNLIFYKLDCDINMC